MFTTIKHRIRLLGFSRYILPSLKKEFKISIFSLNHENLNTAFVGFNSVNPLTFYLSHLLFGNIRKPENYCRTPIWRASSTAKICGADLAFFKTNRVYSRLLSGSDTWHIPIYVRSMVSIPATKEELVNRLFKNKETKKEINRINNNKLKYNITRDNNFAKYFYEQCYVPYTKLRYGKLAYNFAFEKVLLDIRDGEFLVVSRNNKVIAAALCKIKGKTYSLCYSGLCGNDQRFQKNGSNAALYYFSMLRAQELGCDKVNFGTSRAFLNDGVSLFKKKWGPEFFATTDYGAPFCIKIYRFSSPVTRFLENNPMFVVDKKVGLSAIIFLGNNTIMSIHELKSWLRYRSYPGCQRLNLILLNKHWSRQKNEIKCIQPDITIPIDLIDHYKNKKLA